MALTFNPNNPFQVLDTSLGAGYYGGHSNAEESVPAGYYTNPDSIFRQYVENPWRSATLADMQTGGKLNDDFTKLVGMAGGDVRGALWNLDPTLGRDPSRADSLLAGTQWAAQPVSQQLAQTQKFHDASDASLQGTTLGSIFASPEFLMFAGAGGAGTLGLGAEAGAAGAAESASAGGTAAAAAPAAAGGGLASVGEGATLGGGLNAGAGGITGLTPGAGATAGITTAGNVAGSAFAPGYFGAESLYPVLGGVSGVGGGAGSAAALGTAAATAGGSGLSRLLSGDAKASDYIDALGRAAPGLLGAYAANKQTDAYKDLADKYMGFGAPSRARFEGSFAPGFTMASEPGYKDAMDQTAQATLRKMSATGGNPFGNPSAWAQTLKDVNSNFAYPALQNYRAQNAGAGGLAALTAAAPGAASGAINSQANAYGAIGGGLADVFNPPKSLADILKQMGGGGGGGFKFSLA